MDTINYYIERIEKASEKLIKETQLLKKHNKEYDFESLALDGKRERVSAPTCIYRIDRFYFHFVHFFRDTLIPTKFTAANVK